jgi:hypothetical protein
MRQAIALLIGFFVPASLLVFPACSGQPKAAAADAGPYGGPCLPFVSKADLSAPVSFGADVAPIFQSNCTSGGVNCHGTNGNVPYLGAVDGGEASATILASIVSIPSPEDPMMLLVSPTDPANSYLMHKMDGDQCTLAQGCATSRFPDLANCGNDMPNGMATLAITSRDLVRAWIAQGAADN